MGVTIVTRLRLDAASAASANASPPFQPKDAVTPSAGERVVSGGSNRVVMPAVPAGTIASDGEASDAGRHEAT
jgi:hypothetical protein